MAAVGLKAFAVQMKKPDSRAFLKLHWYCWKLLGISLDFGHKYRKLYLLYSIVMNTAISICYPVHLAMELFCNKSMSGSIKGLTICFTVVSCSTKFFIFATKLQYIRKMEQILALLDERLINKRDWKYFMQLRKRLRNICIVFLCFYLPVAVTAGLSFFFRQERSLMYPARFPFDWSKSNFTYVLANMYQFIGMFYMLLQNYVHDTFPAMALCLLSGHIQILAARVARIGHDDKSLQENEEELKRCIQDHNRLYELSGITERIISLPIFVQFFVSTANVCFGIAALLYFVSAPMETLYYLAYCLAMQLQMFPTCYYGSDIIYNFYRLHQAVYESNWIEQTAGYKKHMILFMQRSLKPNFALAGGMVRIHLDTFFATCRGAYSLLAVVTRMK